MAGGHEAVRLGDALEPGAQLAVLQLDDLVAVRADEMVMMAFAAPAVAKLARVVREGVDDAFVREQSQRAVDGREPEPLSPAAQALVELLRGDVVSLAHQLGEDGHALARRPDADALEHAHGLNLLAAGHGAMLAALKTRIVLTCAVLVAAAGCGGGSDSSNGGLDVVAGFYPLAFVAKEVGGSRVDVTNLTPAGAEPHDLELTPGEVADIEDADLVLFLGEGFQPALQEAVEMADVKAIDALQGLELENDQGGVDPHVWLDPIRFAHVVERIGAELGGEAPARQLASRLHALDGEYRKGLAHCERREVVTTHDAFGYLAERYGLEVIPIAGLSPEAEPSPQDLEAIANLVEERGVTTVYTEPLLAPEIGETVAREAGVQTAVLDPLEGLTEEQLDRGENYFTVMRANLDALREGLGCS